MSTQRTNEELVAEIQAGISVDENKVQLFRQNRRFIIVMAKKYMTDKTDADELEDFVSVGYFALEEACRIYNQERGAKFTTVFSWSLQRAFMQYVSKCRLVSIPYELQQKGAKYNREKSRMITETGKDPTDEEISEKTGLNIDAIGRIRQAGIMSKVNSIDELLKRDDGEDISFSEMIADDFDLENDAVQNFYNLELSKMWDILPEVLSKKQTAVIIGIYRDGLTIEHIAKETGRTRQAVDNLKRYALKKLYNCELLKPFYNSVHGIE